MDRVVGVEGVESVLDEHVSVAREMRALAPEIARAAEMIVRSMRQGGKLLVCGNGGSAADAQHIAAELTGRFLRDRRPLPALALHANSSALTAIGNDYGYEEVFSREVTAHGRRGDVLMGISTSGNSANVLRAIEAGRALGLEVIGLTGRSGGKMKELCDVALCVPTASTPRIQEMHILMGHTICQIIEDALC